jgi:hypothetical protein
MVGMLERSAAVGIRWNAPPTNQFFGKGIPRVRLACVMAPARQQGRVQ